MDMTESIEPLLIDVVDNGGQWTQRMAKMLKYLKVDTQIIENTTPVGDLRELDGLILSGGAARVGLSGELGLCAEYLDLNIPILGICAGHQFMARHYGGDARESPEPEFGAMEIELIEGGGQLFQNTNATQIVWEVTMMRSTFFRKTFFVQQVKVARYKEWKITKVTVLDYNFIQK